MQSNNPTLYCFASITIILKVNFVKKVVQQMRSGLFSSSPRISNVVEALYTDKTHVNFIPCLLEATYQPQGWLGIIIGDQLYIDFSTADNFDKAFEELVAEIQAIEERLHRSSSKFQTVHCQTTICQLTFCSSTY